MLSPDVLTEEDILSRKLIVIGSRAQNHYPRFYVTPHLAVLKSSYTLAKQYMKGAHEAGHKGSRAPCTDPDSMFESLKERD
jgi:hypothetical protein